MAQRPDPKSGKKINLPAPQKVTETERLQAALADIVPPTELGEWIRTPNSAFEG